MRNQNHKLVVSLRVVYQNLVVQAVTFDWQLL